MVMVMVIMDMESVMLMLSQKLRPMLSMDMVLGTALILWDIAMDILATLLLAMVMDMVLAMDLMAGMAMDLDTVLTPWDMDMDMAMGMDMDIMVELSDTTNQEWH